jgi:predicted ferric reductase
VSAIELSGDLALLAIFLLTLNLVLGLLISVRFHPKQHWPYRQVNLFKVHNWTGYIALSTAVLHPVPLLFSATAGFRPLDIIFPVRSPSQPIEHTVGALALYLLAFVVVTSYYRVELGHRRWKRLHYCAYAAAALFFTHGLLMDPHLANNRFDPFDAEKVFVEACLGVVLAGVTLRIRHALHRSNARRGTT